MRIEITDRVIRVARAIAAAVTLAAVIGWVWAWSVVFAGC